MRGRHPITRAELSPLLWSNGTLVGDNPVVMVGVTVDAIVVVAAWVGTAPRSRQWRTRGIPGKRVRRRANRSTIRGGGGGLQGAPQSSCLPPWRSTEPAAPAPTHRNTHLSVPTATRGVLGFNNNSSQGGSLTAKRRLRASIPQPPARRASAPPRNSEHMFP